MKKPELFFSFLLVPLDYILVVLAAISAYHLRFSSLSTDIRPVIFNLSFDKYLELSAIIALV
ncbi:MAG TPA: hypothetical protein PKH52_01565, partial [bacterium]|nr:hypothetical protein [bacterium]